MIRRSRRTTRYTIMSNVGLQDARLSWRARGILAYLLSMPDDWRVSDRQLAASAPEGRAAVQTALKELETHGYVHRRCFKNERGLFVWESVVFDEPQVEAPWLDYPATDEPATDEPATVRPATDNRAVNNKRTIQPSTLDKVPNNKVPVRSGERTPPAAPASEVVEESPATETVPQLMEAYAAALGYAPTSYGMEAKAAKTLLKFGYTIADVIGAYNLLKAQAFWQAKHLSLQIVLRELPALAQHMERGGSVTPTNRPASKVDNNINAALNAFKKLREQQHDNPDTTG